MEDQKNELLGDSRWKTRRVSFWETLDGRPEELAFGRPKMEDQKNELLGDSRWNTKGIGFWETLDGRPEE